MTLRSYISCTTLRCTATSSFPISNSLLRHCCSRCRNLSEALLQQVQELVQALMQHLQEHQGGRETGIPRHCCSRGRQVGSWGGLRRACCSRSWQAELSMKQGSATCAPVLKGGQCAVEVCPVRVAAVSTSLPQCSRLPVQAHIRPVPGCRHIGASSRWLAGGGSSGPPLCRPSPLPET